tara:strand:+ start:1016 stop:1294 length:279 start_codon:yes stop_codon:yes gene_type:complete
MAQNPIRNVDTISLEIEKILKDVPFDVNKNVNAKAFIQFNSDNNIIDVNVLCENLTMSNFIKSRLLNSKIDTKQFKVNKIYIIPIKVISKKR